MKFLRLIGKNLRRNLLRSSLTALGTMVLVLVITLIWSVLFFLEAATAEKASNLKIIVTERWQIPSQLPYAYAASLSEAAARQPGDIRPDDSMTWQFIAGTVDPQNLTRENTVVAIAIDPFKIGTMVEQLEDLRGAERDQLWTSIRAMQRDRQAVVIGPGKLRELNKRVGERIKVSGLVNYKGLELEFNIVGTLPEGRYAQTTFMHRDYLNGALDEYPRKNRGQPHPMAQRSLNLVWMKVRDRAAFERVADQVTNSPLYSSPAVKCETLSSGVANFLEAYSDILWWMKWPLSLAILLTLALVIANAIGISVRERRLEMAVLKVLGFQPWHLLTLVLGEALLIGTVSGLASTAATYFVVNNLFGGLKFPIAFFPAFLIPAAAFWWGLAIGAGTALAGSLLPAWSARSVRVAEVFSKIA